MAFPGSLLIRRFLYGVSLLVLLLLFMPLQAAEKDALVFFNWSEYMDPELVTKFEQEYGVKLRQPFYDHDDNRTDLLLQTRTEGYDVVIVDTQSLALYRKLGWLEPLDQARLPNLKHLDEKWLVGNDPYGAYSVPYFWGTTGIAYRKDLVDKVPDSWMDLFRPDASLSGSIGMYRNTVDLVSAALKALGYSINDRDPAHLDEVETLLREQKPHVKTYDYPSLDEKSMLVTGDIKAGMFYNSDTLMVAEFNDNIEYRIPREGCAIWVDRLVVMKSSRNKDLAWKFINFLMEPENAAQLAEWTYGATPNRSARKLLPEAFLQDRVVFPTSEDLARCETAEPLPARIIKKRSRIVSEVVPPAQ